MPYITTAERIGIKKGIEIGIQQGSLLGVREMLQETLRIKFGEVPEDIMTGIEKINDSNRIKELFKIAMTTDSLEEFAINLKDNNTRIIN
jgi:hypothetical protein